MEETSTAESTKQPRQKHECPFPSCNAKVIHLPRHMRQVHGWDEFRSGGVLSMFDLRKKVKTSGTKVTNKKREHKRRICPVKNCQAVVRRIHNHLKQKHKLKTGSQHYRILLDAAKIGETPVIPTDTSTSETSESTSESEESVQKTYTKTKPVKKQRLYETVYGNEQSTGREKDARKSNVRNDGSEGGKSKCSGNKSGINDDVDVDGDIDDDDGDGDGDDDDVDGDDGDDVGDCDGDSDVDVDDGTGNDDDEDCDGDYEDDEDIEDENVDGPVPYFSSSINDKVILSNFHDWLKGPDGGRKDNKCSKQCARQVQMVMQQINPKKQAITDLLSKMTLRDKWLVPVEKKKQPGTVKSYLGTLNQFFIFLHAECSKEFEELNTTASQHVQLSNQVKMWAKSCRKKTQDRFWEKRMEDIGKLKNQKI